MKKIGIFWPGDYRAQPNEWARPQANEATAQLERALRKLGRTPYVVPGYLTRPDEAIHKLQQESPQVERLPVPAAEARERRPLR